MRSYQKGERLMRYLPLLTALFVASMTPGLRAQDSGAAVSLTILTFTESVQLPGTVLPAGKYRFEIANLEGSADAVKVTSEDGKTAHGFFLTTPSTLPQRDLKVQDTWLMFAERAQGRPQAVREWFYPGRSIGVEFVYPKDEAVAIARANRTSVAASDGDKLGRVDESGTFQAK
jgi:hypothetical protein